MAFIYNGVIYSEDNALPALKGSRLVLAIDSEAVVSDARALRERELKAHGEDFVNALKREKANYLSAGVRPVSEKLT